MALLAYLKNRSPLYYGKILELREAVEGWLAYVPQTFPHYTRHTVQHSDELVRQGSQLLFADGDPSKPVIALSAVEAYILVAAAYLHDAGMVSPDKEKTEILASEAWQEWTTGGGGGAKRLAEIQSLHAAGQPADEVLRHFLADIQLRFLIAEFVRRVHHFRAANVIRQHHPSLGRFALDDPVLQRTISDVCVGHGLRPHELDDNERYPSRRDILGEPANVRFLAILLRLSDLLDISHDRACPLLLNAACPLPSDSYAHWTQYQRIVHRVTSPDRIEISAECEDQSEHRLLYDWCQWIVDEVAAARLAATRFARHSDWQPPLATLGGSDSTIKIRPSATAKYIPSKWTFELDRETVFQRLIYDVYTHPHVFVRELIQNALDATRCQLYSDLRSEGLDPPEYPTQVSTDRRRRYALRVSLGQGEVTSALSGEPEVRQVLAVEDVGIGMDSEIIERYLLQVGRSYYTTDEFRRTYRFVPTSRFGVGFLSVFAVSDHVTIDTYKPGGREDAAILLTLTGPRNYLLRERGIRRSRGTRVAVTLQDPFEPGLLTKLVSNWCRRVEFPIVIDDLSVGTTVEVETPDQFTYEIPDVTEEGATFSVRAFPIRRPGLEGEIYIFVRNARDGESWAAWDWARYTYPTRDPRASAPTFPESAICFHGILMDRHFYPTSYSGPISVRLDFRDEHARMSLSRESSWLDRRKQGGPLHRIHDPRIESELASIIMEHLERSTLAQGPGSWKYKQRLIKYFPLPTFWAAAPGMIPIARDGNEATVPLHEAVALPIVTVVLERCSGAASVEIAEAIVFAADVNDLSAAHRTDLFSGRVISRIRSIRSGELAIDWTRGERSRFLQPGRIEVADHDDEYTIGFPTHKSLNDVYEVVILNSRNVFAQWLLRVASACSDGRYGLGPQQANLLAALFDTPARHNGYEVDKLNHYVAKWRTLSGLPPDLYPPTLTIERDMFTRRRRPDVDRPERAVPTQ
jgi:hypothetical protein